jgi:hypothetical protein
MSRGGYNTATAWFPRWGTVPKMNSFRKGMRHCRSAAIDTSVFGLEYVAAS